MATATGVPSRDIQAVEYVTMRAAALLGIAAAHVETVDFAGIPTFVTSRYDRLTGETGGIVGIYQEDFCQALGLYPDMKYEEDCVIVSR